MTADPGRAQMEAYVTGGKHGDGAVFALELEEVSEGGSGCGRGYVMWKLMSAVDVLVVAEHGVCGDKVGQGDDL